MRARLEELLGAIMLLTRLPVSRWARANPAPADCVWAYPLVGVLAGAAGGAGFTLARALLLPIPVAAILATGITVLVTGALHEDGAADTADGFGGGRIAARKLEIMRDSRIGVYGALALILCIGLRIAALAGARDPVIALLLAGVLGRGAILFAILQLRPARADGLAAGLAAPDTVRLTAGLCIAASCAAWAPVALLAAAAAAFAVIQTARRQIGGYTGDVLGAVEQAAECAALLSMAAG